VESGLPKSNDSDRDYHKVTKPALYTWTIKAFTRLASKIQSQAKSALRIGSNLRSRLQRLQPSIQLTALIARRLVKFSSYSVADVGTPIDSKRSEAAGE
jgi:hypothetical protein